MLGVRAGHGGDTQDQAVPQHGMRDRDNPRGRHPVVRARRVVGTASCCVSAGGHPSGVQGSFHNQKNLTDAPCR